MIDLSKSELRTRALSARGPSDVDVMYTTCCHSTRTCARGFSPCGCVALLMGWCDSAQGRGHKHDGSDFPLSYMRTFKISLKSSGISLPCYMLSTYGPSYAIISSSL